VEAFMFNLFQVLQFRSSRNWTVCLLRGYLLCTSSWSSLCKILACFL